MMRWVKRFAGGIILGRQMRVDIYLTIGDLLTSGFALEKAFTIVISTLKDESKDLEAWILRHWSAALRRGRFSQEIEAWVPASEAMIFAAYGRVDATSLFVGAGRVTEMRDRQIKAVVAALAMPVVLFFTLIVMLWGAGGFFIPVMMDLIDEKDWPATSLVVRDVSLWLYAYPYIVGHRHPHGGRGFLVPDHQLDGPGTGEARQGRAVFALPGGGRLGVHVRRPRVSARRPRPQ